MVQLGDIYKYKGEIWVWGDPNRIYCYIVSARRNEYEYEMIDMMDGKWFIELSDRLRDPNIYEQLG
jgi:hypothetical protein